MMIDCLWVMVSKVINKGSSASSNASIYAISRHPINYISCARRIALTCFQYGNLMRCSDWERLPLQLFAVPPRRQ
jgi:hypothetical protein